MNADIYIFDFFFFLFLFLLRDQKFLLAAVPRVVWILTGEA